MGSAPAPPVFALWNLGFRPFYLLAGLFATLSVPVWMAQYAGWLGGYAIIAGPLWHAHEMLFGYAFAVIVGFLFTAGRNWTDQPTPTGATLGAIGGLTLGMMTRTSLGHTGRPLQTGRAEVFCYVAIQLAALTRVFLPLAFPALYLHAIIGSGLLWSLAFGLFTISYWTILSRPRLDGRPG